MSQFPSRNLFSNPSSPQNQEPQPNKKLFIEQPFTPDFGRSQRLPIHISSIPSSIYQKNQLALQITSKHIVQDQGSPKTPKNNEKKQEQQQTGEKIKSNRNEKMAKFFKKLQYDDNVQLKKSRYEEEYTQLAILGSGYFGTVFKCQNRFTNQICAIKCTKIRQNRLNLDIINEPQALAYLNAKGTCKNLVRYYTSWSEGNMLYMVLEYCDYSLKQHTHYEEFEIKQILKDISNGLVYLHEQQISHLDIKPDNILYKKKDRQYKLADLGLSKKVQKRQEDVSVGDARYIARELLNQNEQLDLCKTDIFSFGASLYSLMIKKELPQNGPEWHKLRDGITVNDFPEQTFSLGLRNLICKMMEPDPQKRISAKQILEDEYIFIKKENYIKWEKILSLMLRKQLDDLEIKKRKLSL